VKLRLVGQAINASFYLISSLVVSHIIMFSSLLFRHIDGFIHVLNAFMMLNSKIYILI